jgi:hypothetical protein
MAMPCPRRGHMTVQSRMVRARRRATRPRAVLGTMSKTMTTQKPRRLLTRSNSMLEGEAIQALSIELLGEAPLHRRLRLRSPLDPRRHASPLNTLPTIRVDTGSEGSPGVVVPP